MEVVDVQTLPRKELLQLCVDNNIRTAGVKQDDLVRLLQKKLRLPAADPSRGATKARSQITTNNPISSPRGKEKSAEKTLPTPGSTSMRRNLRPLVVEGTPSTTASPEPSPRKYPLPPNPILSPRKPIATKSNSPPAQKSDLLRKKVNALTAIGKLQGQEKARSAQRSDGSSVRGRSTAAPGAASTPGTGKQAQGLQPRRNDGASARRSTSMEPVKRPGERNTGVKRNEASRFKEQNNPKLNAAYLEAAAKRSPRASKGAVGATGTVDSRSDLGSQDFDTVSEVATDAGHHAMSEDSDADDARSISSVASEPASRFTSQTNRFRSPRASTGSKLGRGASPLWNSAHGRDAALDSSVESNAPEGKESSHSASPSEENLIPPFLMDDDPSFNLVGDTHDLEINSFLNIDAATPGINAAEESYQLQEPATPGINAAEESNQLQEPATPGINAAEESYQLQEPEQTSTPEISPAGCQEKDAVDTEEISSREKDAGSTGNGGETAQPEGLEPEPAPRDELQVTDALEPAPIEGTGTPEIHSPGTEDKVPGPQPDEVSHLDETPSIVLGDQHESQTEETISKTELPTSQKDTSQSIESNSNAGEAEGHGLTSKEKDENEDEDEDEGKFITSTLHCCDEEDEPGTDSPASDGARTEYVPLAGDERSGTCSAVQRGSPDESTTPLLGEAGPSANANPSGDGSVERAAVRSILDSAPRPHPDMERSPVLPMSVDLSRPRSRSSSSSSSTPESADDMDVAGEHDRPAKLRLPCDEVQQDFEIKLRRDYNKDGSVKVPLLQQGREIETTHPMRRSFPSSIFLWCSQLFSAIFGTRASHH